MNHWTAFNPKSLAGAVEANLVSGDFVKVQLRMDEPCFTKMKLVSVCQANFTAQDRDGAKHTLPWDHLCQFRKAPDVTYQKRANG